MFILSNLNEVVIFLRNDLAIWSSFSGHRAGQNEEKKYNDQFIWAIQFLFASV